MDVNSLQIILNKPLTKLSSSLQREGELNLIQFIRTCSENVGEFNSVEISRLLQLCRKLEIKRELYCSYNLNDFLAVEEADVVDVNVIESFLALLLFAFLQTHDYRLLNAVMKVTSYGLCRPSYNDPSDQLLIALNDCCEVPVRA